MAQNPSRGYASSARVSNAPGAYIEILQSDFGVLGGAAPALTPGSAGSLTTSTARVAITWITAQGESQASAEATASVTGATGSVSVAQPTVPAGAIGWRVYSSSGSAGSALLNAASNSTTQAQQPFVTTSGTLNGFPITTTAVVVKIYGAGQAEPAVDASGAQYPLPSVAADTTVDYFFRVPNTGSQWKVQKSVHFMRPESLADPAGILLGELDCTSPVYPGTGATVTAGPTSYFVMNGNLFIATVGGTTASTFIGGAAFNVPKGTLVTDNSVTWLALGKETLVRARFSNSTGSAAAPVAQEYDLFEN